MNEFDFLPPLRAPRKPVKPKPKMPEWCKDRYAAAHKLAFNKSAAESGHYFKPVMPDCNKSNGLTQSVIKFINYSGFYANRISSTGRMIDSTKGKKVWIRGNTQRGTADIHALVNSKHISIEIKIGADKMSEYQEKEKERIENAGGLYWVVKTFEDFLQKYDSLFVPL